MKKLTKEEFIKDCIEKHGDKYDYSLIDYKGVRYKIDIVCPKHGVFKQIAKGHKIGQGCHKCSGYPRINKKEFIEKHGREDYDYSLLEEPFKIKSIIKIIDKKTDLIYLQWGDHHKNGKKPTKIESISLVSKLEKIHNLKYKYVIEKESYYSTDKIKIIDNLTNDEFYYLVYRHLSGMKPNKVTLNYFLLKSKELHGDKYDYSLVNDIKDNLNKVKIICSEHGVFKQMVSNHMNLGYGCPKCAGVGKWNTDLLVSEFKKTHKDKFDYSKVEFENIDKKVEIICNQHGSFLQNIHKHLNGQGCRFCESSSKGEDYIKMWLDDFKINYIRQKSFDTCKYVNKLSFDFYLPDYNICVEFDGRQHFEPIEYFGGIKGYKINKKRDEVKNNWCLDNNVDLLRIKYNEVNKIKYILKEKLQIVDKK